jgi:hypothetical protein
LERNVGAIKTEPCDLDTEDYPNEDKEIREEEAKG